MSDANAPENPAKPQAPATTPAAIPAAPAAAAPTAPATAATPAAKSAAPAAAATSSTTTAAGATAAAVATEPEAPAAPKIKPKKATQRACDEKDAKGKLCCGHLKRWYDYPREIEALVGPKAEIYRCEFCQTIYKPDLSKTPHSYTLRY
jgi:hypothetical protein